MANGKSRERAKPYTGELLTPIPWLKPRKGQTLEEYTASARQHFAEKVAPKWALLFDHYGIDGDDPNRWTHLAVKLASEHVPGFFAALPAGRKPAPRRHAMDLVYPFIAAYAKHQVDMSIGAGAFPNVKAAVRVLCFRPPWISARLTPSTFQKLYTDGGKYLRALAAIGWLEMRLQPPRDWVQAEIGTDAWLVETQNQAYVGQQVVAWLIELALVSPAHAKVVRRLLDRYKFPWK